MGFQAYDPANVKLVVGTTLVEGFAEGSFCNLEFNEDLFSLQVGSDGESARSKKNNMSGRLTIRLMPGAAANIPLGIQLNADRALGAGIAPFKLTDLSTGTTFSAANSWIVKDPGHDFQTEAQAKEWVIESDNIVTVHGAAV